MRLAYVVDLAYPDHVGGSHRVHYEAARRLAARGHDVRLITAQPDRRTPLPEHEVIDAVHYHRFARDERNALRNGLSYVRGARRVFERLAQEAPFDLISAHYALPALGVLSSARRGAAPAVYSLYGVWAHEYAVEAGRAGKAGRATLPRRLAQRGMTAAMWLIEWLAIRSSARLHVLSQFMAEEARGVFAVPAARLALIPGGVDTARFNLTPSRAEARLVLGLPAGGPLLLTVRRLYARMGIDNLLAAMATVVERFPQTLLLIGGTGPLQQSLQQAVRDRGLADNVRLLGFIADDDLPLYYRAADLFVLPTVALEGFGLVTLEALAAGTPVLGTPVGATVEILGALDRRLLCRSAQPADLAAGIVRALDDSDRLPTEAVCRRYVLEHFSWDRMADHLESLFMAVANQRQA